METPGDENGGSEENTNGHTSSIALGGGRPSQAGKGKAHIYVTSNGRNVNRDASVPPPPPGHNQDIMLDLVAAEEKPCLSLALADSSAVISGVCSDHSGLNGFTESPEERMMVGLDRGQEGGGRGGGGLAGTTAVSCPAAVPLGRVSTETGRQIRGETPDSDDVIPGEEATAGGADTDHTRASFSLGQLSCTGKQHRPNCNCTVALSDLNMSNGDMDSPVHCTQTGVSSSHSLALCDTVDSCEGGKIANGGLHILNAARATCDRSSDRPESDYFSENTPDLLADREATQENGPELDLCAPTSQGDHDSGALASECPGEDAPSAAPLAPHAQAEDSPSPGSSAKAPSPCPSTLSDLTADSQPTEPSAREEDDEGSEYLDFSLPARPQSLRTNAHMAVSSLSCDATPLSPDNEEGGFYFGDEGYEEEFRNGLEAGRRQSAPDKLPDLSGPDLTGPADTTDPKLMPKRFGIADFFTRSLFSRKSKEPKVPFHNATGWRLFGKPAAARESDATKDPTASPAEQEEEEVQEAAASPGPQCPPAAGRRKNLEFEPLSTTALILEDRPPNLPAKSLEERERHKLEYDEMVAGAKRRELKEAQKKKRQMKERLRQEESISHAMVIWNNDILPHWDTVKATRRVRELWWQGLPPSVRGRVWSLAIGNELNITPELYEIFLSRAKEKWRSYSETSSVNDSESDCGASLADRESSLDLIKLDISRTFPSLFIFQKGGPYHDLLHSVLGAYTCYRPDIGYVQGMSFIAAVLILNLEEADAFITFANLLNKPCQMTFFRVDHELMLKYFAAFEVFFEENLPCLFSHFQTNNLTPDLYLIDWIFTLYSKSLPLDVACRVWDVFCRDGEESLFRTGLGILRLYQDVLLQMDFIHMAQFLTRLPDDLPPHTLFTSMANTHMISRNRRWAQVFSALMKDGTKEMDKSSSSPALRS